MTERRQWMNKYHTRSYIPHHCLHLPTLRRGITMIFASPTTRLGIAFRTMLKALMCVAQQIGTVVAQRTVVGRMMPATIYRYHLTYYGLFVFYTGQGEQKINFIYKDTQFQ